MRMTTYRTGDQVDIEEQGPGEFTMQILTKDGKQATVYLNLADLAVLCQVGIQALAHALEKEAVGAYR